MIRKTIEKGMEKGREKGKRIGRHSAVFHAGKVNQNRGQEGSGRWIPFAAYCTTGRFMKLGSGFRRHCGPTAAVNLILTLRQYHESIKRTAAGAERKAPQGHESPEELFLLCTGIGRQALAYWNTDVLGRFGGTSNFLTGIFLRRCLRAAGLAGVSVRFNPWITPDAVEKALERGQIVYLEVYRHPRYKNHHMLCYACRMENGTRRFLLADGWSPAPVWTEEKGLGHGHFLTVSCR